MPDEALAALAESASEVEADPGSTIVTKGDFGYAMYLIEAGEADVHLNGEGAQGTLGPGDTFGEIALLVSGRRTAEVVARTPMQLISIFERDVRQACARVPALESSLRRIAGERLG
jgi:CRP-like cAMP-binding protein